MKVSLNRYDSIESSKLDRDVKILSFLSKILMIAAIAITVFLLTSSSFTSVPEIREQKTNEILLSSNAPPAPFER